VLFNTPQCVGSMQLSRTARSPDGHFRRTEQRSWETDDGDRRFKVELVAEEIGAAMRYATVDIHKVERHAPTEEAESSEAVI
jgi:hypothetical protein